MFEIQYREKVANVASISNPGDYVYGVDGGGNIDKLFVHPEDQWGLTTSAWWTGLVGEEIRYDSYGGNDSGTNTLREIQAIDLVSNPYYEITFVFTNSSLRFSDGGWSARTEDPTLQKAYQPVGKIITTTLKALQPAAVFSSVAKFDGADQRGNEGLLWPR